MRHLGPEQHRALPNVDAQRTRGQGIAKACAGEGEGEPTLGRPPQVKYISIPNSFEFPSGLLIGPPTDYRLFVALVL
jgi:hypothetical protein